MEKKKKEKKTKFVLQASKDFQIIVISQSFVVKIRDLLLSLS